MTDKLSKVIRLRIKPDEHLPEQYQHVTPVATRVDPSGEFLELWFVIGNLNRIH